MELEKHNEGLLQAILELFQPHGTDSSIHHPMIARKRAAHDRPASQIPSTWLPETERQTFAESRHLWHL